MMIAYLGTVRMLLWTYGNFIQGNAFENIVCEIAAILSRGEWVKVEVSIG